VTYYNSNNWHREQGNNIEGYKKEKSKVNPSKLQQISQQKV
jgi:hypothetical protein